MEYHGKLYGKFGGTYFDTSHTTDEYDSMVKAIQEKDQIIHDLKQEVAALKAVGKGHEVNVIAHAGGKGIETAQLIAEHYAKDTPMVLVVANDNLAKAEDIMKLANRVKELRVPIEPLPQLEVNDLIAFDSTKGQKSARNLRREAERKKKNGGRR